MKVAFIADPLAGFKTYKDSTFAMMEAAAARGHQLFVAGLPDLFAREGRVYLRATPLTLTGQRDDWYRCGTPQDTDLTAFDAVVMRKDPPFDAEYLYATHLMSVAERLGARCFNRGQAIRDHNEKLAILGYPHLTAPTLVSRDMDACAPLSPNRVTPSSSRSTAWVAKASSACRRATPTWARCWRS